MDNYDETMYTPPVKEGEVKELAVIGFGDQGDPLLKISKYVIILKLPEGTTLSLGDNPIVKITKALPKFGFAELVQDGKEE